MRAVCTCIKSKVVNELLRGMSAVSVDILMRLACGLRATRLIVAVLVGRCGPVLPADLLCGFCPS